MGYDKEQNYCSFSPDKPFGVLINFGCYLHDRQYRNEVKHRKTRLQADRDLRNFIYERFVVADKKILGWLISKIYYMAVRCLAFVFWK